MSENLKEFDKIEWFDICRSIKPELTWDDYEEMWDEFQAEKHVRIAQSRLS